MLGSPPAPSILFSFLPFSFRCLLLSLPFFVPRFVFFFLPLFSLPSFLFLLFGSPFLSFRFSPFLLNNYVFALFSFLLCSIILRSSSTIPFIYLRSLASNTFFFCLCLSLFLSSCFVLSILFLLLTLILLSYLPVQTLRPLCLALFIFLFLPLSLSLFLLHQTTKQLLHQPAFQPTIIGASNRYQLLYQRSSAAIKLTKK